MKVPIKSPREARIMAEGGKRLAAVLKKVLGQLETSGLSLIEIDRQVEKLIKKAGGKPSFKMVPRYHWTACLNINEGVVHGVPNQYRLQKGDLLSVDLGMFYQGFHTDMARTICVQTQNSKLKTQKEKERIRFLKAGERALRKAIGAARAGQRVGHISQAMEKELGRHGLIPVRSLTGHGIGKDLHEPPSIPCFLKGKIGNSALLKPGMVLAVEVIYVQGKPDLVVGKDGWTMKTRDGRLAGLFEDTILVGLKKAKVLTSSRVSHLG